MIDGERCGDATTKKSATCGDIGNKENEAKDQETITTTSKFYILHITRHKCRKIKKTRSYTNKLTRMCLCTCE